MNLTQQQQHYPLICSPSAICNSITSSTTFPHHSPISSSDDEFEEPSTNFILHRSSAKPISSFMQNPQGQGGGSSSSSYSLQQGVTSPASTASGSGASLTFPPNHPLSSSKHLCSICGDRASGKHYGVYSCEGCKGFFKRTVRKELTYACREDRMCIVDKRQRNRCQFCRYEKCLQMGMRREAVQEERQLSKQKRQANSANSTLNLNSTASNMSCNDSDPEQSSPTVGSSKNGGAANYLPAHSSTNLIEFSLDKLQTADSVMLGAFLIGPQDAQVRPLHLAHAGMLHQQPETNRQLVEICETEMHLALQYVRMCPFIGELPLSDQVALVRCGWNELHLSAMGARAMFADVQHGLVLSTGMCITPNQASLFGLNGLIERMSAELIAKMTELQVDTFELACLRGIILFNPDAKGLNNTEKVEACRERLYTGLEEHCHQTNPTDVTRFAKLLLRLPSLRSIGLKCLDLLFFSQLFPSLPIEGFLFRLIQQPNRDLRSVALEVENEELHKKVPTPLFSPTSSTGTNESNAVTDFFISFNNSTVSGSNLQSSAPRPSSVSSEDFFSYPQSFIKQEPSNSSYT